MKSIYFFLIALGATLNLSAQISTFPYTESFAASSPLTGWSSTNGLWSHDTVNGTIKLVNHSQTNVHALLYSPWINTNSLQHPVVTFDMKITADNASACVPQLDLGYDDSVTSGFNVIQINIASSQTCVHNSNPGYPIADGLWTTLSFPLVWYNHIKLEFDGVYPGTGVFEIRNVYVGERLNTGIEELHTADITIAPNPATNIISVSLPQGTSGKLSLLDMTGAVVRNIETKGKATETISLEMLPTGIYMVMYQDGDICVSRKIVKN
jgi:hypothetical protein